MVNWVTQQEHVRRVRKAERGGGWEGRGPLATRPEGIGKWPGQEEEEDQFQVVGSAGERSTASGGTTIQ